MIWRRHVYNANDGGSHKYGGGIDQGFGILPRNPRFRMDQPLAVQADTYSSLRGSVKLMPENFGCKKTVGYSVNFLKVSGILR